MRTLCPTCGTITTHRWSPLPPRCPSCKNRLPLRISRQFTYLLRSFWKPFLFLLLITTILTFSPQLASYRHSIKITLFGDPLKIPPAHYTN